MSSRYQLLAIGLLTGVMSLGGCSSKSKLGSEKKDSSFGMPKKTEAAYFDEAQGHITSQRYDLAEKLLTDLRTFYPVGKHSQQAQLDLIYINFKQREYDDAILAADRFIKFYPNHEKADYARYVKGVAIAHRGFDGLLKYTQLSSSHRDVSYLRSAFAEFKTLSEQYPNSPYTPDAIARMHAIYNQLAEHEMQAARFNIKRGALVGAAERARWVVQYFPQSQAIPEAIATQAYVYQKLGLNQQAQSYINTLQLNYPELVDGNTVKLSAARKPASWLHKLTLGIWGRASEPRFAQDAKTTAILPITVAAASPASNEAEPSKSTDTNPSTNITIGLGLPPQN